MRLRRIHAIALYTVISVGVSTRAGRAQPAHEHPVGEDASPGHPSPADVRESRLRSQRGTQAFARRDWAAALVEFRAAWLLDPRPSVRAAMANCFLALHRPVEAIHHLEDYLRESPHLRPARRVALERRIRAITRQVAVITLTVTPPGPATDAGAMVTVDDTPVSPSHPFRVAAGHHVVEVRTPGYRLAHQAFDARGGTTENLDLTLVRMDVPPPGVAPASPVALSPRPAEVVPAATMHPSEPAGVSTTVSDAAGEQVEFSSIEPDVVPAGDLPTPTEERPSRGIGPGAFYLVTAATAVAAAGWGLCAGSSLVAVGDFNTAADAVARGTADATMRQRGTEDYYRARQFTLWSEIALGTAVVGAVVAAVLYLKTDFHRGSASSNVVAALTGQGVQF